jgi:hypothetical protein
LDGSRRFPFLIFGAQAFPALGIFFRRCEPCAASDRRQRSRTKSSVAAFRFDGRLFGAVAEELPV